MKMNLKEFIHRQNVLRFYRQVLRDVKRAPELQRNELRSYARHEFQAQAPSLEGNKYLLSMGKQQYETVKRSLGI